jgi:8-oxo-dGTP pyrophosphatase MutT (NUDIX family)
MSEVRALLDELRRYQPVDATEERHHRAILGHLVHAKSPLSRAKFKPGHVTASLFIVDPKAKRLLLHHHRRLGRWLQMGGHLERNESASEAALREGREESGLADLELLGAGIFDVDVHSIPSHKDDPEHFHYDVRYVAATRNPESIAMDAIESKELAWVDLDKAIELMNEEASTRAVTKIRKLIAGRPSPGPSPKGKGEHR